MGRASIKENKNVYQLKREELGLSREKASELLECVPPERIEKVPGKKVQKTSSLSQQHSRRPMRSIQIFRHKPLSEICRKKQWKSYFLPKTTRKLLKADEAYNPFPPALHPAIKPASCL